MVTTFIDESTMSQFSGTITQDITRRNSLSQAALFAGYCVLKKNNRDVQIFTYSGAPHGFFAYTQPTYDTEAAKMAWQRTAAFLKAHLGG